MEISEKMPQQLASDNDDIPHATSWQTNCMVWCTLCIISVETNHVVWLAMVTLIASPNQEDQVWPLPGWLCSGMVWNLHWLLNWRTDFPMIPGIVTWLNSYFLTHDQSMNTTKPLVNMSAACCNKQAFAATSVIGTLPSLPLPPSSPSDPPRPNKKSRYCEI